MERENTGLNIKNLLIIFFVLIAAQFMFLMVSLIIVYTNTYQVSDKVVESVKYFAPIIALGTIGIGMVNRYLTIKKVNKISDLELKFKRYSSNMILGWAFFMGATFVSILALFLTHNSLYLILTIISMFVFALTIPTQKRIVNDLKISQEESDSLV
jgi:uncharacterized membrane protein